MVWDAYTRSEILDQWWALKPWKARTKKMDFREGGCWFYAMVGPNGEERYALANYKQIQFQKRFTGLDAYADADGKVNKDLPQSKWEVSFTNKGLLTHVEFIISYDDPAQLKTTIEMGFKEGLAMAMQGLDELLVSIKK